MPNLQTTVNTLELAEQHYAKALTAIKENSLESALNCLNSALTHHPRHVGSLYERSRIYLKCRKFDLALQDINLAIQIKPSHNSLQMRGRIFCTLSRFDEALLDYNKILESDRHHFPTYPFRGEVLYKQGEYKRSLSDLNYHIKKSAQINPFAFYYRSLIYFHYKSFTESLDDVVRYIELEQQKPFSSHVHDYETILNQTTLYLKQKPDSHIKCIKNMLVERLDNDYVATNGRNKYTSRRRRGSILEIENNRLTEVSGPTQGMHVTRFFMNTSTGDQVVVKHSTSHCVDDFKKEHRVWNLYYPRNRAQLFEFSGACLDTFRLVLPRFPGPTLESYLEQPLSSSQYYLIWLDLGLELQRLHQLGWTHLDLKKSNVVVSLQDNYPQTKLIDFGISEPIGYSFPGFQPTRSAYHIAPELFNPAQPVLLLPQVDTFSFVLGFLTNFTYKNKPSETLLERLKKTFSQAFNAPSEATQLQVKLNEIQHFSKTLINILRLNITNPSLRLLTSQVHDWLMNEMLEAFSPSLASVLRQAIFSDPSNRPSLHKILEKIIIEIVTAPSIASPNTPIHELCMWIQHLEPARFCTLLELMNTFDENAQREFDQPDLMHEIARKFQDIVVHSYRGPLYQRLNVFMSIGFIPRLEQHLSSSFAKQTLYIQPIIPLNENHLSQLVHYHESLNSPLGLLICGMLLDGYIVTRVNEHKPGDYWHKRFQDAIVFYLQAGNANATVKPYTTALLEKKGFFARFKSPLKRIQDDHANIARPLLGA